MLIIRLLPLIFTQLLFAAHIMRSFGIIWAIAVLILLFTLFIRRDWILRLWQIIIAFDVIDWIRTTIVFVQLRLAVEMPYLRLLIIMGAVILFNLFVIYLLRRPKVKMLYSWIISKIYQYLSIIKKRMNLHYLNLLLIKIIIWW